MPVDGFVSVVAGEEDIPVVGVLQNPSI